MRIRRKIIAMLLILTILSPFVPNLTSFANSPVFSLSVAGVTDASVAAAAGGACLPCGGGDHASAA